MSRCASPSASSAGETCSPPGSRRCGPGWTHEARAMTEAGDRRERATPSWLEEVPVRPFVERDLETRFALQPGDRALVEVGAAVTSGEALLERLRERRVSEVVIPAPADGVAAG